MFYKCNSIKCINLSNFDTSNVTNMKGMFYNCKNLTSIDLSNFDTSKVEHMDYLFYNCEKLEYINLFNFKDNQLLSKTNIFNGIEKNAVICIDENKTSFNIDLIVDNYSCIVISCNSDWKEVQKNCFEEEICTNCCSIKEMQYNLWNKDESYNDNFVLLNIKKEFISINFDKSYLYNNENDIIIEEGKTKFTITKHNKIKNDTNSSINLEGCENKLMDEYNLDNLDNLIILKINSRKDNNISNKIGFEMYAELNGNNILTKLDMNICNDIDNEI